MRHLARDDVARQAGEDHLPREVGTRVVLVRLEVAEEDRVQLRVEGRVGAVEGVRDEPQARPRPALVQAHRPAEPTACALDHLHGDCVDHLLVESRVGLARGEAVLHEQGRLVEVDRRTIEVFGLNRPHLVEARREALGHYGRALTAQLEAAQLPGDRGFDEDERKALGDPSQPYFAAKQQLLVRRVRQRLNIKAPLPDLQSRAGHLTAGVAGLLGAALAPSLAAAALPIVGLAAGRLKKAVTEFIRHEERTESYSVAKAYSAQANLEESNFFCAARLIEKLEICDFRHIRTLSLDFTASGSGQGPWMTLLGENGIGKSSILQAIALTLIGKSYRDRLGLEAADFVRAGARTASVRVHLSNMRTPLELTIDRRSGGFRASPAEEPKVLVLARISHQAMRSPPWAEFRPGWPVARGRRR